MHPKWIPIVLWYFGSNSQAGLTCCRLKYPLISVGHTLVAFVLTEILTHSGQLWRKKRRGPCGVDGGLRVPSVVGREHPGSIGQCCCFHSFLGHITILVNTRNLTGALLTTVAKWESQSLDRRKTLTATSSLRRLHEPWLQASACTGDLLYWGSTGDRVCARHLRHHRVIYNTVCITAHRSSVRSRPLMFSREEWCWQRCLIDVRDHVITA